MNSNSLPTQKYWWVLILTAAVLKIKRNVKRLKLKKKSFVSSPTINFDYISLSAFNLSCWIAVQIVLDSLRPSQIRRREKDSSKDPKKNTSIPIDSIFEKFNLNATHFE